MVRKEVEETIEEQQIETYSSLKRHECTLRCLPSWREILKKWRNEYCCLSFWYKCKRDKEIKKINDFLSEQYSRVLIFSKTKKVLDQ